MRTAVLAGLLALAGGGACSPPDGAVPDGPGGTGAADTATAPQAPIALEDAAGRRVVLDRPAARIVALVPSVNQILLALGAGDRLVGRTDYDTLPALAGLPSVGGGLGPDLETLALLKPDLVVRFAGDSDTATPAWLDELGVAHVAVRPDRIADVLRIIGWMGRLTGRGEAAARLADEIRDELDAVRQATDPLPTVRTAYLMGGTPPWTAGPDTFIDELIGLAGGENVFGDLERRYAPVSPERVAAREIDVILASEEARVDPRVVGGRTVRRVSPRVQIPGPWLGAAAREVAQALHPDLDVGGPR